MIVDSLFFILQNACVLIVLFLFVGLAAAAGLYVYSLFVEERPSHARTFVKVLIICSFLQTLLCLRFMPWYVVFFNLVGHAIYYMLAKDIPYIDYKSPIFLAGCVTAVLSHVAFTIHFLVSPQWHFWRFLLVNLFTLWTVPLLLMASVVVSPEALIGADVDNETQHKSWFARAIKAVFGKASKWIESLQDN